MVQNLVPEVEEDTESLPQEERLLPLVQDQEQESASLLLCTRSRQRVERLKRRGERLLLKHHKTEPRLQLSL